MCDTFKRHGRPSTQGASVKQSRKPTSYYPATNTRLRLEMEASNSSRTISSMIDVCIKRYFRWQDKKALAQRSGTTSR